MRTRSIHLLLALLLALPALAEKADREKEIHIAADSASADDVNRSSTWGGNVVVTQGTMRITAARVVMKEDAQGFKHYVATGSPVTYREKRDNVDDWVEGFAQRVEFDEKSDLLKLFDNARVKSNQNEIAGQYIQYDMNSQVVQVLGAAPGTTAPANSRVKAVIVPAKKEGPGKAPPPAPVSPSLKTDTTVAK
jgi:lipopolysaccharide export system protein LptA